MRVGVACAERERVGAADGGPHGAAATGALGAALAARPYGPRPPRAAAARPAAPCGRQGCRPGASASASTST